jgi:hypothetical protein
MNQRFEELYLRDQEDRKDIDILAKAIKKGFEETLTKIAVETRSLEKKMEESKLWFRVKRFFKNLFKKLR